MRWLPGKFFGLIQSKHMLVHFVITMMKSSEDSTLAIFPGNFPYENFHLENSKEKISMEILYQNFPLGISIWKFPQKYSIRTSPEKTLVLLSVADVLHQRLDGHLCHRLRPASRTVQR